MSLAMIRMITPTRYNISSPYQAANPLTKLEKGQVSGLVAGLEKIRRWDVGQTNWSLSEGTQAWSSRSFHEVRNLSDHDQLDRVLDVLSSMETVPSIAMYRSLLKACSRKKSLAYAYRLQDHMAAHGFDISQLLGESLVMTLMKCGGFIDALEVFQRLPQRTVTTWTAVISGYTESGQAREALRTYRWMQEEGVEPDSLTMISLLKACGSISDLDEGKRIHFEAIKHGCVRNLLVATSVLDMYAKCGSIVEAQNVFNDLLERDIVSWNAIIAAYASNGETGMSFHLYEQMLCAGICPDARTFVSMLRSCNMNGEEVENVGVGRLTRLESLQKGKHIHCEAWMRGYESNVFLGSALVSFYSRCGCIVDAQNVFDGLVQQNVVSWNALLAGYVQQSQPKKTLYLYENLLRSGVSPDNWTFVGPIQACGMLAEKEISEMPADKFIYLDIGKTIHAHACRRGFQYDNFVSSSLVSMYGKAGSTPDAQIVFSRLCQRNVVSWTAMLAAYARNGQGQKGFKLYQEMLEHSVSPNSQTLVAALQACSVLDEDAQIVESQLIKVKVFKTCKAIHAYAWKVGYQNNSYICNTLIRLYGKCGSSIDARTVFDGLLDRNLVAWNAMLATYAHDGQSEKVWELYNDMLKGSVSPNDITFLCLLQVCRNIRSLDTCKTIHRRVVSTGTLSLSVASSLIHSYSRCADMVGAQNVFESIAHPDVVIWTALIAGYAERGNCDASLHCYAKMLAANVKPDKLTFLAIIFACSHAGFVDKGVGYFICMSRDYGLTPEVEHYTAVADLLGRAGCFSSLELFLSAMPVEPNLSVWLCLLSACRKYHNISLGRMAFDNAVRLQPSNAAAYVLMSNIYAQAGVWERVQEVNALRQAADAWERNGHSWIQTEHRRCHFVVGGMSQPQEVQVLDLLLVLSSVVKQEDYSLHFTSESLWTMMPRKT